jgi:hypothetical protein
MIVSQSADPVGDRQVTVGGEGHDSQIASTSAQPSPVVR